MELPFKDKVVIVTGGTRGIGRAISWSFAQAGARVLITARDKKDGSSLAEQMQERGHDIMFASCDASSFNENTKMASLALEKWGRIDVLCTNVGIYPSSAIENIQVEDWDHVQAVNVRSTFLSVQACLPAMKSARYGRIVVISSITGPLSGQAGWSHYSASKAAQVGFVKAAACELAVEGIAINAILPGNIRTESWANVDSVQMSRILERIPMARLGDPNEIAKVAMFLASDAANYMTGQAIVVDGGLSIAE